MAVLSGGGGSPKAAQSSPITASAAGWRASGCLGQQALKDSGEGLPVRLRRERRHIRFVRQHIVEKATEIGVVKGWRPTNIS
ncbi:MAG: hypothetical protein U0350_07245 [Caldilineaceae bacterium]